ncbi:hypothetical protein IWX90DRAFT_439971 [Phyllosticta citrichinensis]|uniref:Uncharacterized protein n=1 Tax=Phyllosticta citrichinensis TaxID=1130410 RepID=A0ABR1XKC0_9PEZI
MPNAAATFACTTGMTERRTARLRPRRRGRQSRSLSLRRGALLMVVFATSTTPNAAAATASTPLATPTHTARPPARGRQSQRPSQSPRRRLNPSWRRGALPTAVLATSTTPNAAVAAATGTSAAGLTARLRKAKRDWTVSSFVQKSPVKSGTGYKET